MAAAPLTMAFNWGSSARLVDSTSDSNNNNFQFYQTLQTYGSTGSCSGVPSHVQTALTEAQNFTKSCPTARIAPGKMIAINDYSGQAGPTMYVFDQSGNCKKSMRISWGVGTDKTGRLEACSTANGRKTPPGFHLTVKHDGAAFNSSNSLGMAGLSGQSSYNPTRKILIHATQAPGAASTWGCTGVPPENFADLQKTLGYGSLVYNYFGSNISANCTTNAGTKPVCQPEAAAVSTAKQTGGGGGYVPDSSGNGSSGGSGGQYEGGAR